MEGPGSSNWRRFTRLRPGGGKRLKQSARKIEKATVRHAHKFIISRYESIRRVKRQAFGWLAAVSLLVVLGGIQLFTMQNSFSGTAKSDGGVYAEGVIGQLDVINPLFASSQAERSVSRLVYAGLLGYDSAGELRGELAESWRIERDGARYVVELKPDLKWHDGRSVSADDIVFTVRLMQDPATRSNQEQMWGGIKVEKLSDRTIAFDLPRAFAAFPNALTFGILPEHIFEHMSPESLRESPLNREPIGAGPFVFSRLQVIDLNGDRMVAYLTANPDYVYGKPRLDRFQLHTFSDSASLKNAFIDREINAAVGLSAADTQEVLSARSSAFEYNVGTDGGVYAFMNTGSEMLQNKAVRQAMVRATDRQEIGRLLKDETIPLGGPLLSEDVPGAKSQLKDQPYDQAKAADMLTKAGWKPGRDGIRKKNGQSMTIRLVSIEAGDYPRVVQQLSTQWQKLGIKVETQLVDPATVQQNVIVPRAYDVLVYELEIGSDPDVYAFWHKSQAGPRGLNLSNYQSDMASEALESAQARFEPEIRFPKYETFASTWVDDAPAIALYQPSIGYVVSDSVSALQTDASLPSRIDRYVDVHHWTINKSEVYKTRE